MNQQINLKELSLDQLKAFAWDLRTAAEQYTQYLQTVSQEINARLQQEAAMRQQQAMKPVPPSETAQKVADEIINGDPAAKMATIKKGKK